ncbi:MAG: hypothetical protein C0467_11585 [Planctomycetaceae bacterium]|nr:hypothetical protein [Planctomycetaceae bacterium]
MRPDTCPTPEVLSDFGLGLLPDVQIEAIGSHLDSCAACRRAAELVYTSDPLGAALRRTANDLPWEEGLYRAETLVQRLERPDTPATLPPSADTTARQPFSPTQLGPYRLLREVAAGGMGVVYEAEDTQLQRRVALKVMKPTIAADPSAKHRFLREARAAARLKDDHIVTIHDVGEADERPYLVMEFLDGPTLGTRLGRGRRIPAAEALPIAIQVARGLAAAHRQGVIHRDIKPDNIWIGDGSLRVKILDFGLARSKTADPGLTHANTLIGTPAYMSPEQARTGTGAVVDARCDLFSLGCVLYRALTGRVPFAGDDTLSTLMALATHQPPSPHDLDSSVPPVLSAYVIRLLEKDPARRPATADDVVHDLEIIESSLQQPTRVKRRKALFATAGFGLVIGLAAAIGPRPVDSVPGDDPQVVTDAPIVVDVPVARVRAALPVPPVAVAPFNSEAARGHQEAWARYLNVPIETTNSLRSVFRLLPPGEFLMGSNPEEVDALLKGFGAKADQVRVRSGAPRHRVRLTHPFYMAATPVTQREFQELMGQNPSYHTSDRPNNDRFGGRFNSRYPVEQVTWFDAIEFCNRLSTREGLRPCYARTGDAVDNLDGTGYRLPTEAEWEYACRAGTTTRYFHGDEPAGLSDYAWFHTGTPLAVGMLKPNQFGLYDIVGNVGVWCQDWYDPKSYEQYADSEATDPKGPSSGQQRVQRGAFFGNVALALCPSRRWSVDPQQAKNNLGFRVVREIPR